MSALDGTLSQPTGVGVRGLEEAPGAEPGRSACTDYASVGRSVPLLEVLVVLVVLVLVLWEPELELGRWDSGPILMPCLHAFGCCQPFGRWRPGANGWGPGRKDRVGWTCRVLVRLWWWGTGFCGREVVDWGLPCMPCMPLVPLVSAGCVRDLDPKSWSRGGREFAREAAFSFASKKGYHFRECRAAQGRLRQDNPDSYQRVSQDPQDSQELQDSLGRLCDTRVPLEAQPRPRDKQGA